MKLSHREPKTVAREAELTATLAVGSGDLLGHWSIISIIPSADSVVVETKDWGVELHRSEVQCLLAGMNAAKGNQSLGLKSQPTDPATERNQSPLASLGESEQPQPKQDLNHSS